MKYKVGHAGYWKGKKRIPHSQQTRKKMSDSHKGKKLSIEHKKNISKNNSRYWLGKKRKKLSDEVKMKMSLSHKKNIEKCPWWKGGTTKKNVLIRQSFEYRLWKKSVFKRDNYTCIWCGSKKQLEADHIKSFAFYPELRFAIDNGRVLCRDCHKKTGTYLLNKKI